MAISLPIDADANELLSASPLALLIGMLLDQQVTIEKAFTSPRDLVRRLGHEPAHQVARRGEGLFDGHLLIEQHADEQGEWAGRQQVVGVSVDRQ